MISDFWAHKINGILNFEEITNPISKIKHPFTVHPAFSAFCRVKMTL